MNTLAHLGTFVACVWLAIYGFNTLEETAIGFAALVAAMAFLAMLPGAVSDDLDIIRGKQE